MFIQTESTPNPATLKFLPGLTVLETVPRTSIPSKKRPCPLAERLFEVEGVTGDFLGSDVITVHKTEDREWFLIKPSILGLIMEHFTAGRPVMRETEAAGESSEEDSEVVTQIKDLLDTRVRPAVAMDGGDIVFHEFKDGVVYLHMRGACAGCPSSTATLKMGIENMLKHYVPDVREVTAV